MRLVLIRHGDPDYANDTLTEKGWKEAKCLAKTAKDLNLGTCYMSPLGRAQDTASCTLETLGITAETLDWLEEFPARFDLNEYIDLEQAYPNTRKNPDGSYVRRVLWDMAPGYYTEEEKLLDRNAWKETRPVEASDAARKYDYIIEKFDAFLAEHGYVREGNHYRVEKESTETITFFCHFALICVLLSRLWNCSPVVLWHGLALAPTSVTELFTEERVQGIAHFRATKVGDQSHLYAAGEEPSFACRYCEVYSNMDQKH